MADVVDRLLRLYPPRYRPVGPAEPLGNAGGLSGADLWRFAAGGGRLLARAWPIDGPDAAGAAHIHVLLRRLGPLGVVPVPIPAIDGRTAVEYEGRVWEVSPWIEHDEAGGGDDESRSRAAFATLAAVHRRLETPGLFGPSPGLTSRLRELEALRDGGLDRLREAVAAFDHPGRPLAARWLAEVAGSLPGLHARLSRARSVVVPLQPCLRDPRPEHFLFRTGRLVGLVDFGAVDVDCVSGDLARLTSLWFGDDRTRSARALAEYEDFRPLSGAERGLIREFEHSAAILGPGRWLRRLFVERRELRDPGEALARLRDSVGRFTSASGRPPA